MSAFNAAENQQIFERRDCAAVTVRPKLIAGRIGSVGFRFLTAYSFERRELAQRFGTSLVTARAFWQKNERNAQ